MAELIPRRNKRASAFRCCFFSCEPSTFTIGKKIPFFLINNNLFQSALLQLTSQTMDPTMLVQIQTLQRLLLRQASEAANSKQDGGGGPVHFDRKLLDFDYGSDEEEDHTNPSPKAAPAPAGLETVGKYVLPFPLIPNRYFNLCVCLVCCQTLK